MTCRPSPFPLAVLTEATRISPHRRGSPYASGLGIASSDGICGDAAHEQRVSDHDPDARGIPHAVDISQSTPGAPYWDPRCGIFDAHEYGWLIARRMAGGYEKRVKYLVSFLAGHDVIFDPAVSMTWRDNGTANEHASHLHVSFTVAAEQSTAPFFVGASPTPPVGPPSGAEEMIATNPNGPGYVAVDSEGHVYAYGVPFHGGADHMPPGTAFIGPCTGVAMTSTGQGYFLINARGMVYAFGDAHKIGDPAGNPST